MLKRFSCCIPVISLLTISQATIAAQFTTDGQLSVGANGAARYVLPIKVPVGIAGIQPNLSIVYDSSAGNGLLGTGTDVTGFSKITRCAKTIAQDGVNQSVRFTQSDAYCLDGERLVPISGVNGADGTEYRTESETFSKIVSTGSYTRNKPDYDPVSGQLVSGNGGPVSFIVQTKSGQTLEYGTTGDSQVKPHDDSMLSTGGVGVIEAWALHKVYDRTGNYMTYSYTNVSPANSNNPGSMVDDGYFHPVRIDYTGNSAAGVAPTNSVVFSTDGLSPGAPIQYEGGYVAPRTGVARQGIGTYSADSTSPFTSYVITPDYDNTIPGNPAWTYLNRAFRVKTLQECSSQSCFLPVTFNWDAGNNIGFQYKTSAFPGQQGDYQYFFVDVNGTGKKYWFQISQASDDAWVGAVNADGTFSSSSWTKLPQGIGSLNDYAHYFADVNGDGKMDWIRVSRTTNEAWVALGTGNGGFQFWSKYTQAVSAAGQTKHYFADVDGDGMADWVQVSTVNGVTRTSVALSNGDGTFQFWNKTNDLAGFANPDIYFVDINGDGKVDEVVVKSDLSGAVVFLGAGDGTFPTANSTITLANVAKYYFADINGDGKTDFCEVLTNATRQCRLSLGDGSFSAPYANGTTSSGFDAFADVNGDGILDQIVASASGNTPYVYLASGDKGAYVDPYVQVVPISPDAPAGSPYSSQGYQLLFADLDGDGRDDMIVVDRGNNKSFWGTAQFPNVGKIVSITNGLGASTTISYKSMNDASVYTSDADATGFVRDAIYPLFGRKRMPMVVSAVAVPNGIGGQITTNYTYGGMKTDNARRRQLGFRWVQASHPESGITERTEFRQDWPLVGLISKSTKSVTSGGNNGLLGQSTNTFGCSDFVSTSGCAVTPGRRYFGYISQSVTSSWDLNGAALPVVTNTYQFDAFGNPTQVVESTSDGFSKTTTTTYTNDTTKWWIGLAVRQSIRFDSP